MDNVEILQLLLQHLQKQLPEEFSVTLHGSSTLQVMWLDGLDPYWHSIMASIRLQSDGLILMYRNNSFQVDHDVSYRIQDPDSLQRITLKLMEWRT